MMQSVPAHTYASRDALHYLVINYIYSCPDACLRFGGHKYKTSVYPYTSSSSKSTTSSMRPNL